MRLRWLVGIVIASAALCADPARADILTESGDAGQLPGTAQIPHGLIGAPLEAIVGTIGTLNDVDLYRIHIFDPKLFSATTVGTPGTLGDTQLFLFNALGRGVYANDEATGTTSRSTLPGGHALSPTEPGYYFLAISAFDRDPISAGGLVFPSFPFTNVFGPTGPGGAGAVSDWSGGGTNVGTYRINLTGANIIPEPSAWLMGCLGAVGALGYVWRRRFAARSS